MNLLQMSSCTLQREQKVGNDITLDCSATLGNCLVFLPPGARSRQQDELKFANDLPNVCGKHHYFRTQTFRRYGGHIFCLTIDTSRLEENTESNKNLIVQNRFKIL